MSSTPKSATPTLVNVPVPQNALASQSQARRVVLFFIFCVAQFLDVFANSALFSGIPSIARELGMDLTEASWLLSAYALTFSALLLVSGKMSDVWSAKPIFIIGINTLAIMSLVSGFIRNKIALLVIRAIAGVGASLTIPPALRMIVQMFPDEGPKARAISIFRGVGALANILGLIIGAVFIEYASWPWIFWFLTILALPCGLVCLILIPNEASDPKKKEMGLDIVGITTLACALLLFIFAITSGSSEGWASARVLAPLLISLALLVVFFVWEARLPEHKAALPPKMWFYPNFSVLFVVATLPYFWYTVIFIELTSMWQEVWGWSALNAAVHFLPTGIVALILSLFANKLPNYLDTKYILLASMCVTMGSTVLLAFAATADDYWRFVFPAFILSGGVIVISSTTNISMYRTTPPNVAGVVGAVFNSALQLGSSIGLAATTAIQTSVDAKVDPTQPGYTGYEGRSASFWFVLAFMGVQTIALLVFYRPERSGRGDGGKALADAQLQEKESEERVEKPTDVENGSVSKTNDDATNER